MENPLSDSSMYLPEVGGVFSLTAVVGVGVSGSSVGGTLHRSVLQQTTRSGPSSLLSHISSVIQVLCLSVFVYIVAHPFTVVQ